jgi:hypothetical protein
VRPVLWSLVTLRGYAEVRGVSAVYDRAQSSFQEGWMVRSSVGEEEKEKETERVTPHANQSFRAGRT